MEHTLKRKSVLQATKLNCYGGENMASTARKFQELKREFTKLPDVLIQHPTKSCAYYLTSAQLESYRADSEKFAKLRSGTVTFVITGGEIVDELPAFNQDPSDQPDILVRFPRDRTAYLLPYTELERYKVDQPIDSFGDHYMSFIVPGGMELVEEIPLLKKGLLQSNTG